MTVVAAPALAVANAAVPAQLTTSPYTTPLRVQLVTVADVVPL